MPRRGENIFKRKDGRWEGRYPKGRKPNGRIFYGSVYAKTYSAVKVKLENKKLKPEAALRENNTVLFRQMSEQWMLSIRFSVKESTVVKYQNLLDNHILAAFGQYRIQDFRTTAVEQFARDKLDNGRIDGHGGLSGKTVRDMLSIIHEILKHAEQNGVALSCTVDKIHIRKNDSRLQVLSKDQQSALEQYLLSHENCRNTGILICLYMGLRIGEICALKWDNILLEDRVIRICSTMQRVQDLEKDALQKTKVIITAPKSASSIREVPIPDFLLPILKRCQPEDSQAWLLTGDRWHFIEPRTYQYYFQKILELINIPHINFHALRHTFATRCVEAGFDTKSLSEILGHSKVSTTLDRYVHVTMEMKRKNMKKIPQPQLH